MNRTSTLALFLTLVATPAASAQWSDEELDAAIAKFLQTGTKIHLEQIGELIAKQDDAWKTIAARIHGDHREYLLQMERLIDQLTDERWAEREKAERTLYESGAKARTLLEQRKKNGKLLEERIRCERILMQIDARGTDKEDEERAKLQGLVATALYLRTGERLTKALVSALGHTDPLVVERAIRALGAHGTDDTANSVRALLERGGGAFREIVLHTLARMPGVKSAQLCKELLGSDELSLTETMHMMRVLRMRDEAKPVVQALTASADGLIASGAMLAIGEAPRAGPTKVKITLSDRTEIEETFRGMIGDCVVIDSPVAGLTRVQLPFDACDSLVFANAKQPAAAGACRVFLNQGSLVSGALKSVDAAHVVVASPIFGDVKLPRTAVQGIALDPKLDRLIGGSTKNDRVRLGDNKFVDGNIVSVDGTAAKVDVGGGKIEAVELGKVAGLLFTRPLQAPLDNTLYTRVDLVTGDRVLGHVVDVSEGAVAMVAPLLGGTVLPIDKLARMEFEIGGGALWGFTLIADYADNRLVEVDEQGKEVFVMEEIYGAWDVECLDSGNLLITEFAVSRVQEVTREGETVWQFEDLRNPYDADRLRNGNTLIADTFRGRVIEVSKEGKIVWSFDKNIRPFDVDRLPNGNTLVADVLNRRVIEVSPKGEVVWEKKELDNVFDADRLPNGNTLITLRSLNRVVEVDKAGKEVFRIGNLNAPSDADRLPNGHTLVAENNMVREFDRNGNVVWKKDMTWAVEVNRY